MRPARAAAGRTGFAFCSRFAGIHEEIVSAGDLKAPVADVRIGMGLGADGFMGGRQERQRNQGQQDGDRGADQDPDGAFFRGYFRLWQRFRDVGGVVFRLFKESIRQVGKFAQ